MVLGGNNERRDLYLTPADIYSSGWKIGRGTGGRRGKGGIIHGIYFIFLRNDCVNSLCKGSGEGSLERQKREEIKWIISMEGGNQLLYVIQFKTTSIWPITINPCAVYEQKEPVMTDLACLHKRCFTFSYHACPFLFKNRIPYFSFSTIPWG